jgi:hypothetical protein
MKQERMYFQPKVEENLTQLQAYSVGTVNFYSRIKTEGKSVDSLVENE